MYNNKYHQKHSLFQDYYNNAELSLLARAASNTQPKTLIVWGEKDMKFISQGAKAYLRDLHSTLGEPN